jgi:hypothetical protein
MKIEEIEKFTQKESRWVFKEITSNNKLNNIFVKILSFFSVIFSLSIIYELSTLGIDLYLVVIFGLFATLLIIVNEIIKVNKLISLFSFNKSTENYVLCFLTVLLSVIVSTYGIYKFLDRSEINSNIIEVKTNDIINDTISFYDNKIEEIKLLNIVDSELFNSQYEIYNNQLNQYISDRDNIKNTNMIYNNNLRDYYKEINMKIDNANEMLINVNNKFIEYKNEEIRKLIEIKETTINEIKSNNKESKENINNKNYIIISLFIFFTLLTEFCIIYISIKIANINVLNKSIKEYNDNVFNDKISFIKNIKEFKQYEMYKNIIERICSIKPKGSSITLNEIKTMLSGYNLSVNQLNQLIEEFKTIGIISPPVRRIGSKVELDINESLYALKKYFEPYFIKY